MTTIYHILARGIEKRKIFIDDQDYFRFVHDLFEFNDENLVNTTFYLFSKTKKNLKKNDLIELKRKKKSRKFLVNIHAFCLMHNHYHLLLSPEANNGISRFMHKLNMGFSKYFNKRYERRGTLFEGGYKSILVQKDAHFIHLPYYIHLNPLDIKFPGWRDRKIVNHKKALDFLNNYRWSSHLDYAGKKNFPSVTQRKFLNSFFDGSQGYKKEIKSWLKGIDIDEIRPILLE